MGFKKGNTEWNNSKSLNAQFKKGRILPVEIEEKRLKFLRNKLLSVPKSKEHKRKIALGNKGKHQSEEHKKRISLGNMGKKMSAEAKIKIGLGNSISLKGKKAAEETKKKRSISLSGSNNPMYGKSKELSPNWLGGISFEPYTLDWTKTLKRSIRERDHYICQLCNKLQEDTAFCVHHIDYNKLNCNPNNLITLCQNCHAKTNFNRDRWLEYFKFKFYFDEKL